MSATHLPASARRTQSSSSDPAALPPEKIAALLKQNLQRITEQSKRLAAIPAGDYEPDPSQH